MIKNRFAKIAEDWKKIYEDKMTLDSDDCWKPLNNKNNRFLRRLKDSIVELKGDIMERAEHSDKGNDNKLKDGFLSREVPLSAAQTITYDVLKTFFKEISISMIK